MPYHPERRCTFILGYALLPLALQPAIIVAFLRKATFGLGHIVPLYTSEKIPQGDISSVQNDFSTQDKHTLTAFQPRYPVVLWAFSRESSRKKGENLVIPSISFTFASDIASPNGGMVDTRDLKSLDQ